MAYEVFVSYSNKDKAIADTIVASLEKNHVRCWYAPRDINPSDDWGEAISDAIEKSKIFLIIFSESANRSRHVLDELILAVDEEVTVLPFRVENLEPKGAMRLHLSSRHWLDAFDPSWEEHIQRLVRTVCSNLNISFKEKIVEKHSQVIQDPHKTDKKQPIKYLAAAGIGSVLIAAGWFGWIRLFSENAKVQEEEPSIFEIPTTLPTQEYNQEPRPLGEWNEECWIAYVGFNNNTYSIGLMQPDGSSQTLITDDEFDDLFPKWSSNGDKIAFLSNRQGNKLQEIFVIDINGENLTQYSEDRNIAEFYQQFDWSPVSEQIIYVSKENSDADIYIAEPGGSGAITSNPASDTSPVWSPDGKQIAFVTEREGNKDIFVINAEGENLTQFTQDSANDIEPAWSPDGARIAFSSDRNGKFDIFVMNLDGSGLTQLTNLGNDRYPTWSGDGNKIAFYSDRSGNYHVYLINHDGSMIGRLTDSYNKELFFDPFSLYYNWSPDGTKIMVSYDKLMYLISPIRNAYIDDHQILANGWFPVWSPLCRREEIE